MRPSSKKRTSNGKQASYSNLKTCRSLRPTCAWQYTLSSRRPRKANTWELLRLSEKETWIDLHVVHVLLQELRDRVLTHLRRKKSSKLCHLGHEPQIRHSVVFVHEKDRTKMRTMSSQKTQRLHPCGDRLWTACTHHAANLFVAQLNTCLETLRKLITLFSE